MNGSDDIRPRRVFCSLMTYHSVHLMDRNWLIWSQALMFFLLSDTTCSVRIVLDTGGIRSRCPLARSEDGQV